MSDFAPITPATPGSMGPIARIASGTVQSIGTTPAAASTNGSVKTGSTASSGTKPLGDRVELSSFARYLAQLRQLPDVRLDRVQQVRQAIENGSYETTEKLDTAIDRLLDDLDW